MELKVINQFDKFIFVKLSMWPANSTNKSQKKIVLDWSIQVNLGWNGNNTLVVLAMLIVISTVKATAILLKSVRLFTRLMLYMSSCYT